MRAVQAASRRLFDIFGVERLRVQGLTRLARLCVAACLLSASGLAYLLLVLAARREILGGDLQGPNGPISLLAVVVPALALAAAVGALALAMLERPSRLGTAARFLLVLPAATICARLVAFGAPAVGRPFLAALTLGAAAAAGTLAFALLPRRLLADPPWLAPALAALPYLCVPAVLALSAGGGQDDALARSLFASYSFVVLAVFLNSALVLLFAWQAIEGVRAVVLNLGRGVALLVRRMPALLPGLLFAKLVALALAYAFLAEGERAWARSRDEGAPAWALAALFGLLAAVWVARRRPTLRRTGKLEMAAWFLSVAFSLPFIVPALLGLVFLIVQTFPGSEGLQTGLRTAIEAIAGENGEHAIRTQAAMIYAGIVLAVLLLWRRAEQATAVFLLLVGLWALPLAIPLTIDPFGGPGPVAFGLTSLDTAFTVALALLLLAARAGVLAPVSPALAILALTVSTAVAYAGTLVALAPPAARGPLFALGLLFPLVWQLLADAGELNRGPGRQQRVLAAAGLGVAALAIVAVALASGLIGTETDPVLEAVRSVLVLPLATALVALVAAAFESNPRGNEPRAASGTARH